MTVPEYPFILWLFCRSVIYLMSLVHMNIVEWKGDANRCSIWCFSGLLLKISHTLQPFQNTSAWIITRTTSEEHIISFLKHLHWFSLPSKLCTSVLHWSTLLLHTCMKSLLLFHTSFPHVDRRFRRFWTMEFRAFSRTAPHLWSSLPQFNHNSGSLYSFKSILKSLC